MTNAISSLLPVLSFEKVHHDSELETCYSALDVPSRNTQRPCHSPETAVKDKALRLRSGKVPRRTGRAFPLFFFFEGVGSEALTS